MCERYKKVKKIGRRMKKRQAEVRAEFEKAREELSEEYRRSTEIRKKTFGGGR